MIRYWLAVAVLAATACVLETRSAAQENQSWDEAMHLTAGFQYWRTGDFTRNWQHPPLAKIWAAIPLLWMDIELPKKKLDEVEYGREFLFNNRTPHERILGAARAMMIAWSVGLILVVAWFTQRHFGWQAGLVATALTALDPNLLAHGHYITTDVPNALFFFLTCALWAEYLWRGSRWAIPATGVSLGLALSAKFSAVVLVPLLLVIYFMPGAKRRSIGGFVKSVGAVAVLAGVTVWLVYMPGHRLPDPRPFAETVTSDTLIGKTLRYAGEKLKLQSHPFLAGVDQVAEHNRSGHPSYLLGEIYEDGRWQYFPVAFGVKTPVAVLALAFASLFFIRRDARLITLFIAFATFFAFCASSRMNMGLRHLLPVYPFLFVLIAVCWMSSITRVRVAALAVLLAVQVWEVQRVHPHYLAFFNAAAGGPDAGTRYLVDSNLDWGQDLDNLIRYVRSQGADKVCIFFFGSTSWDHYKVGMYGVPGSNDREGIEKLDCIVAASATPLMGLYVPPEQLAWLRHRKPDTKIGWSIFVWDFRKNKP